MLRWLLAAGGRSGGGGGAKGRFMDVVGKDMKLVRVRKKGLRGRKWTEADNWLLPPLKGTAGRKKNEICSSALTSVRNSHICSQGSMKVYTVTRVAIISALCL